MLLAARVRRYPCEVERFHDVSFMLARQVARWRDAWINGYGGRARGYGATLAQGERLGGDVTHGGACRPNYSAAGRRRRKQIALFFAAASAAFIVLLTGVGAPWYARLLIFFPGSAAAGSFLQVKRNTCVARARAGVFEHEDFSVTAASDADATTSRRVAATIRRDAILFGVALALVAAAAAVLP
jgi:hypothetical protein